MGVCKTLNGMLWSNGIVAVCPKGTHALESDLPIVSSPSSPVRRVHHAQRNTTDPPSTPPSSNTTTSTITAEEVFAFQILFWLSIILFVAALFASNTIASLGIPNDSPLL